MTPFLDEFVTYLQAKDASPHTVAAYRRDVKAFLTWLEKQLGKAIEPAGVTPFDVRKYRDHLQNLGRKPAGINRRLAALRSFFAWAVEIGRATSNPAADIKGISQERRRPKALNAQEVYKLQREATDQRQLIELKAGEGNVTPAVVTARRDEALVNLFLYTGLRVDEAANLQVNDVVLRSRSGKVVVRSGKGRKYREIPLHKEAREALKGYLKVRPDDEGNNLFLGQRGPLGSRGIQMRLKALGQSVGIEVTPHVLRHSFATRLLREADVDLVTVAALMGHSSVATTAIYTQPSEDDLVDAVENLE